MSCFCPVESVLPRSFSVRLEAVGQRADELGEVHLFGGALHGGQIDILGAQAYVALDRAREQKRVLQHHAEACAAAPADPARGYRRRRGGLRPAARRKNAAAAKSAWSCPRRCGPQPPRFRPASTVNETSRSTQSQSPASAPPWSAAHIGRCRRDVGVGLVPHVTSRCLDSTLGSVSHAFAGRRLLRIFQRNAPVGKPYVVELDASRAVGQPGVGLRERSRARCPAA